MEFALYGTKLSYRLLNWRDVERGSLDGWEPVQLPEAPEQSPHMTALHQWMKGQPHQLADFALGMRVQEVIEAILREVFEPQVRS